MTEPAASLPARSAVVLARVAAAAAVAFAAAGTGYLVVRHLAWPRLEALRPVLVERIAAELGRPVEVAAIESGWARMHPRLTLRDVALRDESGATALAVPVAHAEISWRSLLFAEPRFTRIELEGVRVDVARGAQGDWRVAGVPLGSGGEPGGFGRWLLAQGRVDVRDATVRWRDDAARDGPTERVASGVDLVLRNAGRTHRVLLRVAEAGDAVRALEVRGDFMRPRFTRADAFGQWYGDAWAGAERLDIAQASRHLALPGGLAAGTLSGRGWVRIDAPRDGRARTGDASVRVEAAGVAWPVAALDPGKGVSPAAPVRPSPGVAAEMLRFGRVALDADLDLRTDTVGLRIGRAELAVEDGPSLSTDGGGHELLFERGGRPLRGHLGLAAFDLGATAAFAERLPLPTALRDRLRRHAPQAQVSALSARWLRDGDGRLGWIVDAGFERASARAQPDPAGGVGVPGFANLAGRMRVSDRGGRLALAARDASLVLPGVFADPALAFERLSADLDWQNEGAAGRGAAAPVVELRHVRFANADTAGELSGRWRGGGRGPAGIVDLEAQLQRAEARRVPRYLPLTVGVEVRDWLAGALAGGQASGVRMHLAGDLERFPFVRPGEGTFRVSVPVRDVRLDYAPGWPLADGLSGELLFEGAGMSGRLDAGRVFGVRFGAVTARIPDFHRAVLRLEASGAGPAQDMLRFVDESPLRASAGGFTDLARIDGDARLAFRMSLPVSEPERTTVEGAVQFAGNALQVDPDIPRFTQIGGRLDFSDRGIGLRGLRGLFLGGPIQVEGDTVAPGHVVLRAEGAVSATGLRGQVDSGLMRRLTGSARYEARLDLRGRSDTRLRVNSDLQGLASALPAPFGKPAETPLPLTFEARPLEAAAPARGDASAGESLAIRLGETVRMAFERRRDPATRAIGPVRGILAVNADPVLPEAGFAVHVDSPSVDVDAWSRVLGDDRLEEAVQTDVAGRAQAPGGGDLAALVPSAVTIRTDDLVVAGRHLAGAVVGATRAGGYWGANVHSRGIDGYFSWRDALPGQPIGTLTARFGRLVIPESRRGDVASLLADAMPDRLPGLDVAADELVLGDVNLGAMQLVASNEGTPAAPVWRIETLALRSAGGELKASGRWGAERPVGLVPVSTGRDRPEDRTTRLDFDLQVDDAARLLSDFGLNDVLRGGSGRLTGEVSWRGMPMAVDPRTLDGHIALEMGRGQFLKADPGLAKLIGVLNLQSLPRRLNFDFRDVFAEGFAFDRISGRVAIDDGVARADDLRMQGVAARVAISGSADIGRETQDLTVDVVPQLNAGLGALAYAAMANPAIGLGSFVAQFVLREPLQALFAYTVDVRGSWADPVVVRRERRPLDAPPPEVK